jgi:hypothetical protein
MKEIRERATSSSSSTSCTTWSAPAPPRARSTRPRSSSRRSPAASCRPSARRRWTSTASTSSATPPSSAASSRSRCPSRPSRRPCRSSQGLRDRYEAHHRIRITDEALNSAAELADRYISDRFLPDKAIDLIDEAASRKRIQTMTAPPELPRARGRDLAGPQGEGGGDRGPGVREGGEPARQGAQAQPQEARARGPVEDERRGHARQHRRRRDRRDRQHVDGHPGRQDHRGREQEAPAHGGGAAQARRRAGPGGRAVSKAIRRARAGLKDPRRPPARSSSSARPASARPSSPGRSPSSSSATRTHLVQLDMSEYMEKHTVSRLVGSPPGYVGYEEGGQLTEVVRRARTAWCSSTRSRRPTPTSSTSSCRSSRTGG